MIKISKNKDINTLVNNLISSGWSHKRRRKHHSIISPEGRMIIVPSTPSDRRSFYNFRSAVKVMDNSQGVVK